jgi:TadE-like protein
MKVFPISQLIRTRRAGRKTGPSSCAGQATVEMALVLTGLLFPLMVGLISLADLAWTYHALTTLTRKGAHYAATHCFQDPNGSNVVSWMQANAPPFLDKPQLSGGSIQIDVQYWSLDLANQQNIPFDGSSCAGTNTPGCVPDAVTVGISGYQYRRFLPALQLQPITVPAFSTTVEVESGGGDPEIGTCNPETGG